MAAQGEDARKRTGLDRILGWLEREDDEATPQVAFQTLEDEYLY